ncbi:MAG: hypothetical protein VX642_00450 [Bdellovibrionota bacterium]|nr:hypothetical protein [Bdellovibrionota bacterium]
MKPWWTSLKESLLTIKTEVEATKDLENRSSKLRNKEEILNEFNASRSFGAFGPGQQNNFTNSRSRKQQ